MERQPMYDLNIVLKSGKTVQTSICKANLELVIDAKKDVINDLKARAILLTIGSKEEIGQAGFQVSTDDIEFIGWKAKELAD